MPTLLELRKSKKLDVADVASRLAVTTRLVHRWEAGTSRPTDRQTAALARLLGVPKAKIMLPPMQGIPGKELRATRTKYELSMAELGDRLGISRQAVMLRERQAEVERETAEAQLAAIHELAAEF